MNSALGTACHEHFLLHTKTLSRRLPWECNGLVQRWASIVSELRFRRKVTLFKGNALTGKTVGKSLFELGTYAASMDQLWADGTMTQVGGDFAVDSSLLCLHRGYHPS